MRPCISFLASMLLEVTCSHEHGRVPPLMKVCFENSLEDAFSQDACVVWLSDSVVVCPELKVGTFGVLDKHLVKHSAVPIEFTRSVDILANIDTMETRAGTASTNLVDSIWKHFEEHIPPRLSFPRTMEQIERFTEHIRFSQWMYMTGKSDKWAAFCEAVQHFEFRAVQDRVAVVSRKVPAASAEGAPGAIEIQENEGLPAPEEETRGTKRGMKRSVVDDAPLVEVDSQL